MLHKKSYFPHSFPKDYEIEPNNQAQSFLPSFPEPKVKDSKPSIIVLKRDIYRGKKDFSKTELPLRQMEK